MKQCYLTTLFGFLFLIPVSQITVPRQTLPTTNNNTSQKHNYGSALQTQKANEIKSVYQTVNRNTPNTIPNNPKLGSNSPIPSKQMQSMNYVSSVIKEIGRSEQNLGEQLPPLNTGGNQYFLLAYKEITEMLEGKRKLDLKRAVFLTENACYNGTMNYSSYTRIIKESASIVKAKIAQEKMAFNNNVVKNYMLHQFMCDTLTVKLKYREQELTSYPMTYDFNDPFGYDYVNNLFVTKLMAKHSGQCKSLPLYYLILLEELGGEAYLCFSPSHSYIKFKDNGGNLLNLELTNGMLTSDSWVVGSGFVKAEAVKSGIYLDTLNKKQVIANCLIDLARYYKLRFGRDDIQSGYDEFVLKCINKSLSYHDKNIYGLLEKSNYYTALLNYMAFQLKYKTEKQVLSNPKTKQVFLQRNQLYALTDRLGYEAITEELYLNWINSLNQEQRQKEHKKQHSRISKMVRPSK